MFSGSSWILWLKERGRGKKGFRIPSHTLRTARQKVSLKIFWRTNDYSIGKGFDLIFYLLQGNKTKKQTMTGKVFTHDFLTITWSSPKWPAAVTVNVLTARRWMRSLTGNWREDCSFGKHLLEHLISKISSKCNVLRLNKGCPSIQFLQMSQWS